MPDSTHDLTLPFQTEDGKKEPLWLSVSEAAKLGGITTKTIRRAIQSKSIKYKLVKERYLIDFASVITFLHSNQKLKNKLNNDGLGRYVIEWNVE